MTLRYRTTSGGHAVLFMTGVRPQAGRSAAKSLGEARADEAGAMSSWKPDWAPTGGLAVGKGATLQQFIATVETTSLKSMSLPGAREDMAERYG